VSNSEKGTQDEMDREKFERAMNLIVHYIESAGYDAYYQIQGYLLTDDETYITRNGKAREYIKRLDKDMIQKYINRMR